MLKILVVDDEDLARQRLCRLIHELEGYEVVGEAADGRAALKKIDQLKPDIVVLDIRMPTQDGLSAAKEIAKMETPPAIIFSTAYDEYAIASYDVQATDYLLKPVSRARLAEALSRVLKTNQALLQHLNQKKDVRAYISARVRKDTTLIPVEEIIYFSADQKYTCVHYQQGEVLIEESLKDLAQEFQADFIRVHRNALVAVREIVSLSQLGDKMVVVLRNGVELDVSRRMLAGIRKLIAQLAKR